MGRVVDSGGPRSFEADVAGAFGPFRWEDQRECFEGDIAKLGAEEAERQFGQAVAVLEGLCHSAENIGVGMFLTLSRAQDLAKEAQRRARAYTEGGTPAQRR